jgi:hypothetical protein
MRGIFLLLIAMCCAVLALPANAVVAVDRPAAKSEQPIVTVAGHCPIGGQCDSAAHCPAGTRWVPAKYGRAGKWRVAHCTNWGVHHRVSPTDTPAGVHHHRVSPTDITADQLNAQERAQHQSGVVPPGNLPPGYR